MASFFVVTALAVSGLGHVFSHAAQNAGSAEQKAQQHVVDKRVQVLIQQLGDDSYEARASAAKSLAAVGDPALKLLEQAARESKDAEVRQQAEALVLAISQPRFFFISLESKANLKLTDSLGNHPEDNVGSLAKGINAYAKKWFKVEDGLIQLSGSRLKKNRPAKVEGIQVNRGLARLHLLHGASSGSEAKVGDPKLVADGTLIGQYAIHFADGTKAVIPIEYGKDVRDYTDEGSGRLVARGSLGWTGGNSLRNNIRVYVSTWDNPSPSKSIARIDYQSMNTASAPFCIGLSGELMPEPEDQTQAPVVAWCLRESVGLSGPLVMDDMVVVGDDLGLLRALQTRDGREVWTHKHERRIYDAPVCDSEHVYFSSDRGVVAVSRARGKDALEPPDRRRCRTVSAP